VSGDERMIIANRCVIGGVNPFENIRDPAVALGL
jgi:hypothetical protein